ncbi:hypothetical protein RHMOL_Rhmol09G0185800 [Rhododendron molle]|uniref:Uncharacterized protein n=1 Tax=Rhododendron molle TaxID=49168 RepID=A0ACC0MEL5_RHOML|nr:hypothetical protein RHMOL_Rhmol09G0185800 [Rhododendron molle]
MASLDSEIVENIEAERNKTEKQLASLTLAARNEIEKQLASLTLAAPNAHLREQLTPLSDKDEENFDPERNKMEKQLASLTLAAPNAHLHEQLTTLIGKDEENCDAMDCDQQIDVLSQLPTMEPAIYRYLSELSNEEYEDLLKYTASKKKVHRAKKKRKVHSKLKIMKLPLRAKTRRLCRGKKQL